jgi:hypothetical protein
VTLHPRHADRAGGREGKPQLRLSDPQGPIVALEPELLQPEAVDQRRLAVGDGSPITSHKGPPNVMTAAHPAPECIEQGQQGQAEDGEVIALDALEQLHAWPSSRKHADAIADLRPVRLEIVGDEASLRSRTLSRASPAWRHRRPAAARTTALVNNIVRPRRSADARPPLSRPLACRSGALDADQAVAADRHALGGVSTRRAPWLSATCGSPHHRLEPALQRASSTPGASAVSHTRLASMCRGWRGRGEHQLHVGSCGQVACRT